MSMTASARPVDGGPHHLVDVNGRHTISTDEPTGIGGTDLAPAPHELLPAMLAACASTMIAGYPRAREIDISGLRVDVAYEPATTPRRVRIEIQAPAHLGPEQIARLRRIADTCPVKRALEAGFRFEEAVIVAEDSAVAGRAG